MVYMFMGLWFRFICLWFMVYGFMGYEFMGYGLWVYGLWVMGYSKIESIRNPTNHLII